MKMRLIGKTIAALGAIAATAAVLASCANNSDSGSTKYTWAATLVDPSPLIIAHRGASAARPEHSIEAYRLAIEWGADYVEQDLVMSKDGVLMCMHDITLGATTDVATKFPDRYAQDVDGNPVDATGTIVAYADRVWLPKDFTRAELKTLLLHERYSSTTTPRTVSHSYDNLVGSIPTFEEAIEFIQSEEQRLRKTIGIYPETKAPQRHKDWGLPMEDEVLRVLNKYGYVDENSPCFIQSFEDTNLKEFKEKTDIRLIQLISNSSTTVPYGNEYSYADMATDDGLARVAKYAYGIGPGQKLLVGNSDGAATDLATRAHAAGLKVHSYTVRNDDLPAYVLNLGYSNYGWEETGYLNTLAKNGGYKEMSDLLDAGDDGMFTDFSCTFYQLCVDKGYR